MMTDGKSPVTCKKDAVEKKNNGIFLLYDRGTVLGFMARPNLQYQGTLPNTIYSGPMLRYARDKVRGLDLLF